MVFVHGLNGDRIETWRPKRASHTTDAWPWWLAEAAPLLGVWTYGYEAAPSTWIGRTMPLSDRASNFITWLEATGLGERPLIFVAHSLGGLLVKQALELGATHRKAFTKQVKLVIFLATPHFGSDLANIFLKLGFVAIGATQSVRELTAHNPDLDRINTWYRNQAPVLGIDTNVFYETQPIMGRIVVDKISSNPGIRDVLPAAVTADHLSIARPASTAEIVYLSTYAAIQRIFVKSIAPRKLPQADNLVVPTSELVGLLAIAEEMKANVALGNIVNFKYYVDKINEMEQNREQSS